MWSGQLTWAKQVRGAPVPLLPTVLTGHVSSLPPYSPATARAPPRPAALFLAADSGSRDAAAALLAAGADRGAANARGFVPWEAAAFRLRGVAGLGDPPPLSPPVLNGHVSPPPY